jgi:hypothetical protein
MRVFEWVDNHKEALVYVPFGLLFTGCGLVLSITLFVYMDGWRSVIGAFLLLMALSAVSLSVLVATRITLYWRLIKPRSIEDKQHKEKSCKYA